MKCGGQSNRRPKVEQQMQIVIVLCGIVTLSKQKIRIRDAAAAQDESVKEQ